MKKAKETAAQNWLAERLHDLTPSDFHAEGVAIYLVSPMVVPDALQSITHVITPEHCRGRISEQEIDLICRVPAVLVLCDTRDQKEVELALILNSFITTLNDNAPPVILVPHSSPEAEAQPFDAEAEFNILSSAMTAGIDCTLIGQPQGVRLACEVAAEIMRTASYVEFFSRTLDKNHKKIQDYFAMKEEIDDCVWDYLRTRLSSPIPQMDYDLDTCRQGAIIGNFQVGRELGEGGSGRVYALKEFSADGVDEHGEQVMKTMLKKDRTTYVGLKILNNEINVMKELASEKWGHPAIIKLHQVYHSEDQILFRMESGGPVDLYKCLRAHETSRQPLGYGKARSVVLQNLSGLCHMHLGPKVVHRDIKPENIVVRETEDDITIKICDFDLARIVPHGSFSNFLGGTFPFMAPEIMREKKYDPFPTDVWSMAMVFLEVLCYCGVLSKALAFPRLLRDANKKRQEKQMTLQINDFFKESDAVWSLLNRHHRAEFEDMMDSPVVGLLDGMLNVDPVERYDAAAVVREVAQL
jgi:hypothetical protein